MNKDSGSPLWLILRLPEARHQHHLFLLIFKTLALKNIIRHWSFSHHTRNHMTPRKVIPDSAIRRHHEQLTSTPPSINNDNLYYLFTVARMTRRSIADEEDVERAVGADDSNSKPRKPLTLTAGADSFEVGAATDVTLVRTENDASDRWGPSRSTWMITTLVLVLGFAVAAAFLGVGVAGNNQDQKDQFERTATDIVNNIQSAWLDYKNAAALIHNRCRSRNFTRAQFRNLYEYLIDGGLDFQASQFDPNITDNERASAEAEAASYYAKYYPHVNYRGFVGFETENSTVLEPRSKHAFYFPIHYMEPILGNEAAIDLDYYASGSRRRTVVSCMETGQPALTDRLRLVQETQSGDAYGVVLMHPGVNLTSQPDVWPRDLASIVIRIRDLLRRSVEKQGASSLVYIYDSSDTAGGRPMFLGGVHVDTTAGGDQAVLQFLPEIELDNVHGHLQWQDTVTAANKIWIVSVAAPEGTYKANNIFVVLGGVIICIASISLALWICTNARRVHRFNYMKAQADAEKTALVLDSANQATKAERELNDFIAHEVRNPVAAAMSACSFVQTAIRKPEPIVDPEARQTLQEDVEIIDNALKFVNDLLRNMLDMHRATNKQLIIDSTPTDLLHDVLEPVEGMLHYSGSKVDVVVECPKDLVVLSDHLRLKQVILNLGRNSVKFIEEGFIKLQAKVVNGQVQLAVEDSGPGIPMEKRERLFCKYQESLDMLSQGTVRLRCCTLLSCCVF